MPDGLLSRCGNTRPAPRQVVDVGEGAAIAARATFPRRPYAHLEEPDTRDFAIGDPHGSVTRFPAEAVLDGVQRAPQLHSYLQARVDEDKAPGRWILTGSQQLGLSALQGPLFENWVVSEVMKHRFNHLRDAACHYFLDSNGNEIGLVIEFEGRTIAVEIKSRATLAGDGFRGLHRFAALVGGVELVLIYGGKTSFEREGVSVVAWR